MMPHPGMMSPPGMMPQGPSPFDRLDADHDGKLTKDEVMQHFAKVDADGDGSVTKEELMKSLHAASGDRPNAGPQAQGNPPSRQSGSRGEHGVGQPPFGRGPMGRGPMGGGPMPSGPRGPERSALEGRRGPPPAAALLAQFDKDQNGKLTKSELPEPLWDRLSKADANSDGELTQDEIEAHLKAIRPDGTSKPAEQSPAEKAAPAADNTAPDAAKDV